MRREGKRVEGKCNSAVSFFSFAKMIRTDVIATQTDTSLDRAASLRDLRLSAYCRPVDLKDPRKSRLMAS